MSKFVWLLLPVVLASCAYFQSDKEILVTTANGKPAYCTLKNNAGTWRGYSGKPIKIAKEADGNLKVSCAINNYRASKTIKPDSKNKYPDYVMVTMRPKKVATNAAADNDDSGNDNESMSSPKDNDDNSSTNHTDDAQDMGSKPLNILPDAPENEEEDVIITKHR